MNAFIKSINSLEKKSIFLKPDLFSLTKSSFILLKRLSIIISLCLKASVASTGSAHISLQLDAIKKKKSSGCCFHLIENKHTDRVKYQGRLEVGRVRRFMSEKMRDVLLREVEIPAQIKSIPGWQWVAKGGNNSTHVYPYPSKPQQFVNIQSHRLFQLWHSG